MKINVFLQYWIKFICRYYQDIEIAYKRISETSKHLTGICFFLITDPLCFFFSSGFVQIKYIYLSYSTIDLIVSYEWTWQRLFKCLKYIKYIHIIYKKISGLSFYQFDKICMHDSRLVTLAFPYPKWLLFLYLFILTNIAMNNPFTIIIMWNFKIHFSVLNIAQVYSLQIWA